MNGNTTITLEQNGNVVSINIESCLVTGFLGDLIKSNPTLRIGINCRPELVLSATPNDPPFLPPHGYSRVRFYGPKPFYVHEKIKAIKAVREVTSMGLMEAKVFIESPPQNLTIHNNRVYDFIKKMNSFGFDVKFEV